MSGIITVKRNELPAEIAVLYTAVVENNGFHDTRQKGILRDAPVYGWFTSQHGYHFLVPLFKQCCLYNIVLCDNKPHLSGMPISGYGLLRTIEK